MANYQIEIQRNNVTLAQFLRYVRQQCAKKGIDVDIDRDSFENPYRCESSSYTVVEGVKKSHFAEYRQVKKLRRKFASYQTPEGYTRYYYTDEFEEYEETELCRYDHESDGTDAPCKAETVTTFPYEFQTYILNHDGTMFNEICEFTFDEGNIGYGYYYQKNVDQIITEDIAEDAEDAEDITPPAQPQKNSNHHNISVGNVNKYNIKKKCSVSQV